MYSEFCLCLLDAYSSTNPADWRVVLGEHHLGNKEVFEQSRGVKALYLHPKYKSMFFEGIYDTPPDYDVGKLYSVIFKSGSERLELSDALFSFSVFHGLRLIQ